MFKSNFLINICFYLCIAVYICIELKLVIYQWECFLWWSFIYDFIQCGFKYEIYEFNCCLIESFYFIVGKCTGANVMFSDGESIGHLAASRDVCSLTSI